MAEKKSKKIKAPKKLTSKQNKVLKGMGHHLSPVAMVGKEGISANVLAAVNEVLTAHELVKIKVQNNSPMDRKEIAAELSVKTGASIVHILGKTILLYRENIELDSDRKVNIS